LVQHLILTQKPFDPKSPKKAGKKSKRDPAKKKRHSIKEKMEMLYEKVLDDLLTKIERVKLFVTLSGYLFLKNKPVKENIEPEKPFNFSDFVIFASTAEATK
jgi:hypothetical protein